VTEYRYETFSAAGQTLTGVIQADTVPSALELLHQRGIRPYLLELDTVRSQKSKRLFSFGKPGLEWRARFIRQLSTLLAAGVTLDRSLLLLVAQAAKKQEKLIIEALSKSVNSGQSLSIALTGQAGFFHADEIGLVKASEHTGSLAPVLEELSTLLERRLALRSKLASALVYPAFLLTLAPISLIVIATVLVPNLAPLFENSGATMPFALSAMIWFSTEIHERGLMWLLAIVCFFAVIIWISRRQIIAAAWARILLNLPFFGLIKRKTESARICRTLGSLLRSGAPMQTALQAIVEITSSEATREDLRRVRESVSAGRKLGDAMKIISSLEPSSLQMIAIGEETNKLDTMLLYVADGEEKSLSNYIDRLMTLLTPLLTIALGLFVGGIVMSIMRAILSVNELVAK
jgi:general secretion pathway protein F